MSMQVFVNVEQVKKLMQEKGVSVKDLAKQIGSTPKTITKWLEGNQKSMTVLNLIKIGRALNVDFRSFLIG